MSHNNDYSSLFASRVQKLTAHGDELRGCCPFHEDTHPSWSGNRVTGLWKCHACSAQGNAQQFAEKIGETVEEKQQQGRIVATYDYHDEHGKLLFQSVRYEPKNFRLRRPVGKDRWEWNLENTKRVLYRLKDITKIETVYIVEGEKDADRLWALGISATTNPLGAGKWRGEYNESLRNKHVVIIADNDEPGEQHTRQVARALLPRAKTVKLIHLPGLPPIHKKHGEDVSDWLNTGHTKEELAELVKATAVLRAEDLPSPPLYERDKNPWILAKPAPDFLVEEEKELTGLAKDIIAPGAVTLIAAPRGLGKTQTSHALAVALATGGRFRDEQVKAVRVLLLDRDNPEFLVKKRLRSWGATEAPNLHVLTRQHAPDLKNKEAWSTFPVEDYDVLIVDSVGASTEGVTEKEGKQTTEILATVLDLARKGLAILLLTNCTKDALSLKGRGEWSDRADIIYEVRDATGFTPSGKKPWWQELPEAGEAAWADRAARRKGKIDFRLAFIASKFRLSVEPDPFCLELHLPADEPWTLRDATADILKAGENTHAQGKQAKQEQLQKAVAALKTTVSEREASGTPLLKTEAQQFLCEIQDLKRSEARQLLSEDNPCWRLENRRQGEGKQAAWCLLTKNGGNGNDTENPRQMGSSEGLFAAAQAESSQQRQIPTKLAIDKCPDDSESVAESDKTSFTNSLGASPLGVGVVADVSVSGQRREVLVETVIDTSFDDSEFVADENGEQRFAVDDDPGDEFPDYEEF